MGELIKKDMLTEMKYAPNTGKLFLGGISWETSEDGLRQHFSKYGNIVDCVIMSDPQTHRPRGFGFVTFDDPRSAVMAAKEQFQTIDGRRVEVKTAVPKETMANKIRTKKIFVGGISWNVTDDILRRYFTQFGVVVDAQVIRDHVSSKSRGFGYVTFQDEDTVDDVVEMPHKILDKDVDVKKAVPKNSAQLPERRRGSLDRRSDSGAQNDQPITMQSRMPMVEPQSGTLFSQPHPQIPTHSPSPRMTAAPSAPRRPAQGSAMTPGSATGSDYREMFPTMSPLMSHTSPLMSHTSPLITHASPLLAGLNTQNDYHEIDDYSNYHDPFALDQNRSVSDLGNEFSRRMTIDNSYSVADHPPQSFRPRNDSGSGRHAFTAPLPMRSAQLVQRPPTQDEMAQSRRFSPPSDHSMAQRVRPPYPTVGGMPYSNGTFQTDPMSDTSSSTGRNSLGLSGMPRHSSHEFTMNSGSIDEYDYDRHAPVSRTRSANGTSIQPVDSVSRQMSRPSSQPQQFFQKYQNIQEDRVMPASNHYADPTTYDLPDFYDNRHPNTLLSQFSNVWGGDGRI